MSIIDPPLSGATQVIITLSGSHIVVGAIGVSGIWAAKILTAGLENALNPYIFLASTLNEYVNPWVSYVAMNELVVKPETKRVKLGPTALSYQIL